MNPPFEEASSVERGSGFPSSPVAPVRIRVIGLGGAGGNITAHLSQCGFDGVEFAAANTDTQALSGCAVANRIQLGARIARGLGTGGDPELGRTIAEADAERLKELCAGAEMIFIVAGLGGGTGTGTAPVVARIARECGALVLGITTLPWENEGPRRMQQAVGGLKELQAAADAVICLPNEKIFRLVDEHTNLPDSFQRINEVLSQGVRGVWQMLAMRGIINIDFADLRAVLGGRHAESAVATSEASGDQRARVSVEQLLASPLLVGGEGLAESDTLLLSIRGGPDLEMGEVNRVMELVRRQCAKAHIIMGAAVDPAFAGRLGLTLIASRKAGIRVEPPAGPADIAGMPTESDTGFFQKTDGQKASGRLLPPPPDLSPEKKRELMASQSDTRRGRRHGQRMKQELLPLDVVSKGRFEKSSPNIRHGEDLDLPTYIRRGVSLN